MKGAPLLPLAILGGAVMWLMFQTRNGAASPGANAQPAAFAPAFEPVALAPGPAVADAESAPAAYGPQANLGQAARQEFQSAPIFTSAVAGGAAAAGAGAAAKWFRRGGGRGLSRAAPAALTRATVGTGVGAGLALGQGAVWGIQKSGGFDYVARAGQRIPGVVRAPLRVATTPARLVGAVSVGLAGRGTVRSNVGRAVEGTPISFFNRRVLAPIGRRWF